MNDVTEPTVPRAIEPLPHDGVTVLPFAGIVDLRPESEGRIAHAVGFTPYGT